MNHANGSIRAGGANAPVVPDRLLALTTEALAFFPETGLRAWRVNGWLAYLSRTATSNPCWKGRRRMTIDASCHNWFSLEGGWLIPNGNHSLPGFGHSLPSL